MGYYESYFDEDLDETLTEAYDESEEDFGESEEDFGESRADRRRRRQERRAGRQQRRQDRRERRRGGGVPPGKPAATGAVQNAFENVGDDISTLEKKVKKAEAKQSDEQLMELLSIVLFRPSLKMATLSGTNFELLDEAGVPIKDANGNPFNKVGIGLNDNLLPLLVVKLMGNMGGTGTGRGIQRFLPLIVALFLSPDALKSLGIGSGASQTGTPLSSSSGSMGDLLKNPLVILLAVFLLTKK